MGAARRQRQRALRHRPGKRLRGPPRRIPRRTLGDRLRRLRDRRAGGRRAEGDDAADAPPRRAAPPGRAAALPDGRRHPRRHHRRGPGRRRSLRLRAADPQRPERLALQPLGRHQAPQRAVSGRHAPDRRHVRLLRLPALHARVPASPAARERDPGRAAGDDPQPLLLPDPDARAARGDRRRPARRLRRAVRRRPFPPRERGSLRIGADPSGIIARLPNHEMEPAVFISSAYAQAASPAPEGFLNIGMLILMLVVFWFILIRPQMKLAKDHKSMLQLLEKGNEVVTSGGLVGKITKITDAYITLEIADNTEILVQKQAVQTLLPKGTMKSV